MQPLRNLGKHPGVVPTRGFGATIYMTSTDTPYDAGYFNITSDEFGAYTQLRKDLFYAVSVEIGYSFGICNGAIYNKTGIDPLTSTSYHDACDSINGYALDSVSFLSVRSSHRFPHCRYIAGSTIKTTPLCVYRPPVLGAWVTPTRATRWSPPL
jgi:hypothetical protein